MLGQVVGGRVVACHGPGLGLVLRRRVGGDGGVAVSLLDPALRRPVLDDDEAPALLVAAAGRARAGLQHFAHERVGNRIGTDVTQGALGVVPGQMAFTLMLCWASWSAAGRVMPMTAPLLPA